MLILAPKYSPYISSAPLILISLILTLNLHALVHIHPQGVHKKVTHDGWPDPWVTSGSSTGCLTPSQVPVGYWFLCMAMAMAMTKFGMATL